jgi:hypothetical protein
MFAENYDAARSGRAAQNLLKRRLLGLRRSKVYEALILSHALS